jgi:3-oxoacyl-[acyl-carrier protein] reductase
MFDLTGKCALVTGASGGIGEAIARALHAQGAAVAISGTRASVLEELAGSFQATSTCCPATCQGRRGGGARSRRRGRPRQLDILVNNAGITRDNLAMRMKDEEWHSVIAVNLTAAFRLARAAMRPMMKRRFGRIISITSVVGVTGNAGQANYAAAKAGMIGMTKALAQELASRAITVNCVAPGFIETAMTAGSTKSSAPRSLPPCRPGGWASRQRSPRPWSIWPATRPVM